MQLAIEIYENTDASKIFIEDISTGWGNTESDITFMKKSDISSVVITFLKYKSGTTGEMSDWITGDTTLTVPVSIGDNGDLIIEIYATDVSSNWTLFPEGIYYIKYSVVNSGSDTAPTNNTNYVYAECLFSQTQNYRDKLYLNIARDINYPIEESDYYWYTIMFDTKFNAMLAASEIGNAKEFRNILSILQDLQSKYPDANKVEPVMSIPQTNVDTTTTTEL